MKLLARMLCLAMAVIWAPITSHCAIAAASGLDLLGCCAPEGQAAHGTRDCDSDHCSAVESGLYKLEDHSVVIAAPILPAAMAPPSPEECMAHQAASEGAIHTAPPELPRTWQFACRTTPPVRAPSAPA